MCENVLSPPYSLSSIISATSSVHHVGRLGHLERDVGDNDVFHLARLFLKVFGLFTRKLALTCQPLILCMKRDLRSEISSIAGSSKVGCKRPKWVAEPSACPQESDMSQHRQRKTRTHLLLESLPQGRFVADDALHTPPRTISHLLEVIDRPSAHLLPDLFALLQEELTVGRSQSGKVDGQALAVGEKVCASFGNGHADGVAGQERKDTGGRSNECGLLVSNGKLR